MTVRPAQERDTAEIAEVYVSSYRGLDFLPRLHTDGEVRAWVRSFVVPHHEVWVSSEGGSVVGFCALSDDMLAWLYVHPDFQRLGHGSALLEQAKRRRPGGFRFWTFQRNLDARRFYERHGCRVVELTDGAGNEEREPDALYEWTP